VQHFDEEGPWELEVVGFEVYLVSFSHFIVDIVAEGDAGESTNIRLQGTFQLHHPDDSVESLDAEKDSWERLGAVFVLRHDKIALARITKASDLRVEFMSGRVITSSSDGSENWEMNAPGGVTVIANSGNCEPHIWDGDPKHTFTRKADGRWFNGDGEEVSEPDVFKDRG
jgi:hypothetical protein